MKNIFRIRRKRLDHWWYYALNEAFPSREAWREGTHLIEGVQIDGESINQQNTTNGRFEKRLGWMFSGEMEPPQNNIEDFAAMLQLDGPMNFAFQCGDQLHLYRYQIMPGGKVIDNRLSFSTSAPSYGETRERTLIKLGGLIRPPLEIYRLKPNTIVKIVGGKLRFEKKTALYIDGKLESDTTIKN